MPSPGEHPAPTTGPIGFSRLRFVAATLGALVILIFAGSSAYDAWRSYHYALSTTERELDNIANALAEQTAWTVRTVDLLLLDTARWYESSPKDADGAIDAALAARTTNVSPVRQVMIVDATGQQRHRARLLTTPLLDISDRSYFIAQRETTDDRLYISEPLVTRSDNHTAVVLSRRLEDASHRFAGIVTARVDLNDLNQLYRAVDVDAGMAIALLQDNGTLLARNPPDSTAIGARLPSLATEPSGPFPRVLNPLDGHREFIAVASVGATHLRIAVTRDEQSALQAWHDETVRVAIRTGVLMLLATLTIGVLVRQLGRVADGELALRLSEERYALAMEGANEGHWDWELPSDRLFLSTRMKVLGGMDPSTEITTRNQWRERLVVHPEDAPHFERMMQEHLNGRSQRFECEYRVRQSNGEWHWLLARGRCVFDQSGRPLRFVGSAIDMHAQKQSQLDKERLESQLRQSQKMEAIGTLAGGIAHDFNNILGAILGYGELAIERAGADSTLRRYLDNVMHATERAKKLVERILGFSRSGMGNQIPFNVQAVVAETLELLRASLPAGIHLQTRLEGGEAAVTGDPTDLHQVTMNLCTNAIQAMEHGGVLSVSLERIDLAANRALARGALTGGPYLRLVVRDSGRGIQANILDRIFDPFFTTKRVGEGTGLGLSLVHGIVTDLGGAIDVVSAPGAGTQFDIWLPIAGQMPFPAQTPSLALPLGSGQVIMIIDDEYALVTLAEEHIARLGYEPVGFESSTAALQAFEATPDRFDAVITDESMPEMTGSELAREIRRLRPLVPILLMTGHGSAELSQRAAQLQIREVLLKPLHSRDIAEALARAFNGSRP